MGRWSSGVTKSVVCALSGLLDLAGGRERLPGERAPLFDVLSTRGRIRLRDCIGRRPVLLALFPSLTRPDCPEEPLALQREVAAGLDVQVIGVAGETHEELMRFVAEYGIDHPLVADPEGRLSRRYGGGLQDLSRRPRRDRPLRRPGCRRPRRTAATPPATGRSAALGCTLLIPARPFRFGSRASLDAAERGFILSVICSGGSAMAITVVAMNPSVDAYLSVHSIAMGRKLRCTPVSREPGGGGINVARAMHSLGGNPLLVYPAGGTLGEALRARLEGEGLAHHPVAVAEETRENLMVQEEVTGDHLRLVMPGPTLQEREWRACLEAVEKSSFRYLVASGSLPPGVPHDFYARLAGICSARGARFVLDSSGDSLRLGAEKGVFLLKPNLKELERLAGEEITDKERQEVVARHVVQRGWAEVVLLSLGGAGVLMVTAGSSARFKPPEVPARRKLGSGDALVAGTVLALAAGKELREAVRYGVAAGAAAVMHARSGPFGPGEVERLLGTMSGNEQLSAKGV